MKRYLLLLMVTVLVFGLMMTSVGAGRVRRDSRGRDDDDDDDSEEGVYSSWKVTCAKLICP